jgi:hypothetical protein
MIGGKRILNLKALVFEVKLSRFVTKTIEFNLFKISFV